PRPRRGIAGGGGDAARGDERTELANQERRMTIAAYPLALTALLAALASAAQARPFNDPRSEQIPVIESDAGFASQPRDPACHVSTLASTGGALPASPGTLAIRWTGFANFELS